MQKLLNSPSQGESPLSSLSQWSDLASSDVSRSPEGSPQSYRLESVYWMRKRDTANDTAKVSQKLLFSLTLPLKFLQVQSFISLLWWCSLKVSPEMKTELERKASFLEWTMTWVEWQSGEKEKNLSKVNRRRGRGKRQRQSNGWAGAAIAEDNGQYERKDDGWNPSIIFLPSAECAGTMRRGKRAEAILRGKTRRVTCEVNGNKASKKGGEKRYNRWPVKGDLDWNGMNRWQSVQAHMSGRIHP